MMVLRWMELPEKLRVINVKNMQKKKQKKLTEKQKRLIQELSGNIGNKKPKSLYQMLLDSGYSETMAKQQSQALNTEGVKRELKPIVQQLEEKRQEAIDRLSDTVDKATYADLTGGIDKFTKNIQLLGGKPTEIIDDYSQYSDEELTELAKGRAGISEAGVSEKTS